MRQWTTPALIHGMNCSVPSHYLIQHWLIINLVTEKANQCTLILNTQHSYLKNVFKHICQMAFCLGLHVLMCFASQYNEDKTFVLNSIIDSYILLATLIEQQPKPKKGETFTYLIQNHSLQFVLFNRGCCCHWGELPTKSCLTRLTLLIKCKIMHSSVRALDFTQPPTETDNGWPKITCTMKLPPIILPSVTGDSYYELKCQPNCQIHTFSFWHGNTT